MTREAEGDQAGRGERGAAEQKFQMQTTEDSGGRGAEGLSGEQFGDRAV